MHTLVVLIVVILLLFLLYMILIMPRLHNRTAAHCFINIMRTAGFTNFGSRSSGEFHESIQAGH